MKKCPNDDVVVTIAVVVVIRLPSFEPEERDDSTDTEIVRENPADGHSSEEKLWSTVIANGCREGCWLSN